MFPIIPVAIGLGIGFWLVSRAKSKPQTLEYASVKAMQDDDLASIRETARSLEPSQPEEAAGLKMQAQRLSARKLGQSVASVARFASQGLSQSNEEFAARIIEFVKDPNRRGSWALAYEALKFPDVALALRNPLAAKILQPGAPHPAETKEVDWQKMVAAALSQGNPETIRALVVELEKAGKTAEAAALQAELGKLIASKSASGPTQAAASDAVVVRSPGIMPATPSFGTQALAQTAPELVLPPVTVSVPKTSPDDSRYQAAKTLNDALKLVTKGTQAEVALRPRVKSLQTQENLKVDGLYGPQTGLAIASYSIPPRRPLYWPSVNTEAAKTAWRAAMLAKAAAAVDATDKMAWTYASKV